MSFLKITIYINTEEEATVKIQCVDSHLHPPPEAGMEDSSLFSFAAHNCIRIDNML